MPSMPDAAYSALHLLCDKSRHGGTRYQSHSAYPCPPVKRKISFELPISTRHCDKSLAQRLVHDLGPEAVIAQC
jgi:hypothetical protein